MSPARTPLEPGLASALTKVSMLFGHRLRHAQRLAVRHAKDEGATFEQLATPMGMGGRPGAHAWFTRWAADDTTIEINDFGVAVGEIDSRENPGALTRWRSSYGPWAVTVDLDALVDDPDGSHAATIALELASIMGDHDLRWALVVCPTHRVFIDGRHRLVAALTAGLTSVPVAYRCYGTCNDGEAA